MPQLVQAEPGDILAKKQHLSSKQTWDRKRRQYTNGLYNPNFATSLNYKKGKNPFIILLSTNKTIAHDHYYYWFQGPQAKYWRLKESKLSGCESISTMCWSDAGKGEVFTHTSLCGAGCLFPLIFLTPLPPPTPRIPMLPLESRCFTDR